MKHYKELAALQCFTRADAEHITGSADAANFLLNSYQKKGLIESVKRNLYIVISLETGFAIPNRYRIASNITDGAYITHHSAFEYYGCANQVYYEVYISGKKKFASFEHDSVVYRYFVPRTTFGVNENPDGVRVTDTERTMLDGINDFDKTGGFEELMRCLELIPCVDEDRLLSYLEQYDKQFLYQKVGYILNHLKDELRLSEHFFESCERKVSKSVRYLYNDIKSHDSVFDTRWQLFVPKNLLLAYKSKIIMEATI